MRSRVRPVVNAYRRMVAVCALLTLAACRFGDSYPTVDYEGRTYAGMGSEYYILTDEDVSAIGVATNIVPRSMVSDVTVFQVDGISPDQLIAMRAAPPRPYEFELFRDPAAEFPTELCELANPAKPPSEEACP